MMVGSRLQWSLRHTRQRLFECILIILAVGLGVAVIVTVVSVFARIDTQMDTLLANRRFRLFEVRSPMDQVSLQEMPPIRVFSEEEKVELSITYQDLQALQSSLPEGMHVFIDNYRMQVTTPLLKADEPSSEGSGFTGLRLAGNAFQITETTVGYYRFHQPKLAAGSWFLEEDVQQGSKVIVLGSRLADRLFPDSDAVGRKLPVESWWGTVEYEVIGVLAPAEEEFPMPFDATADIGFVPISGSTHGPSQRYPSLYIGVDPELDLQHAYEVVQSEVAMKFGEAAAVRSPLMDYQRSQAEQSRTMILVAGLASVGLIVAIINILNLILARVLRRTKSIGLSLAIGSSRRMIFQQFLLESLVLGLLGAGVGVGLSFGFEPVLGRLWGNVTGGSTWIRVLVGCGLGILVSLLFGVYPAYQGAKVNPADALRSD